MKNILLLLVLSIIGLSTVGQTAASAFTFIDYQKSFPRMNDALRRKEDTLMKQFQQKNLPWPAKYIYLRSFKYDSQLEVWVKYDYNEKYKLFKTYKVCALAGSLGPKRMQGDFQVPEGFYYINEFNPKSMYHLSLGLNYPNSSDRILSDSLQPGGDIYIHVSCVTTGCIPITDQQIEDLYILAAHARTQGQDFIPVHIFPIQFKNQKSADYLTRYLKDFPEYSPMVKELKQAYQYFEKTKQVPIVMVNKKGRYVIDGEVVPDEEPEPKVVKKRVERQRKIFTDDQLAKVVDKLPQHPGGQKGFQQFLDDVSTEMSQYLDKNQSRTYVRVEFIIDREGNPAYARVVQGGNDELNEKLELKFEGMPKWTPAMKLEKKIEVPVAMRLLQSIEIGK